MEKCKEYSEDCPLCQPVLYQASGKPVEPESLQAQAWARTWKAASLAERQAFYRVTVLGGRVLADMEVVSALMERLERAVAH